MLWKKDMSDDLNNSDKLLYDVLVQNLAMQKLLLHKKIISENELKLMTDKISSELLTKILINAGVEGDIPAMVNDLIKSNKEVI